MDRFESLIGGMAAATFFAEVFRRRFLHVAGAARGLVPVLPGLDEVESLLGAGAAVAQEEAVCFLSFPPLGTSPATTSDIDATEPVHRTFYAPLPGARPRDAGEATNLLHADRFLASLRPVRAVLEERFRAPAHLQLFHARRGAGLRPHSDIHDSFVIQIAGHKRWRFRPPPPPGQPIPPGNEGGALDADAASVVMAPGDVLYKPSHAVHATESLDERTLSLTASLVTRTTGELVRAWIEAQVAFDPVWRARLPLDEREAERVRAALDEGLVTLREQIPDAETLLAYASALWRPGDEH